MSLSCGEFFKRDNRGRNHMTQGVQKQIGILPAIETEAHLVEIGCQMLCGDAMPCADDAALQERESRFHGVRVDVSVHVHLGFVFDRLVLLGHGNAFHGRGVGVQFVGHDYVYIFANVVPDELCQCAALNILSMEEAQIAATLPDTDYDLLVGVPVSCLAVGMLLSANVGFVHFDSTVEHGPLSFFHGSTNAMAEIPCGLVADAQGTLDLVGRHSLACFTEEYNSGKPCCQRKMRIVEYRSGGHGEVVFTLGTIELLISLDPRDALALAAWTLDAVGPSQPDENFAAFVVGIEQSLNV
jgi:hypothetical protein